MYHLGTPEFCSNHIRLSTDFFVSVMKRVISESILYSKQQSMHDPGQ